jgi:hypothetical protein
MSDPNKDWLEKELESLRDLEAPPALLPKVMKRVHQRAGKPWTHLLRSPANLWRSFVLGISLAMLGFLLVINPAQFFSHVPGVLALFNLLPLLLDAAKTALLQAKVFNLPLLELLAAAIVLSYILLVATASAIQHLASARK